MPRYWVGVVSREHALCGVRDGIAQVCHGKKAALSRMKEGDGLIYYSPKLSMDFPERCQCFTAIGQIRSGKVYQVEITEDFHPFRLDVAYEPCREVSMTELLMKLEFTKQKSWGLQLLRGVFEISKADYLAIADAMKGL